MAIDDTDGAGPESFNLTSPEGTVAEPFFYPIGAYYWNDHGFGPSAATVVVFIEGLQVFKIGSTPLETRDMWYVGKIHWPNTAVGGGNLPPVELCMQSGDPCLALTAPNDPKAGKMWTPSGQDFCVTHCYQASGYMAGWGLGGNSSCP